MEGQVLEEILLLILNSIMQIVKIIEAKDIYTADHSMRVSDYSEMIARGINKYYS